MNFYAEKRMIRKALTTLLLTVAVCMGVLAQTKVIAHRGYWDCEGSAQNSIASLNKAHEAGVYGSELDVWITTDGVVVVNHDRVFQGFCIEESTYDELRNGITLRNGEKIPTIEEYLVAGKKNPETKLIIEIKSHKRVVDEDRAVAAVLCLVQRYAMEEQVEYIAFSMNACKELIRRAPAAQVAYLNGDVTPRDLKTLGFTGLDYSLDVLEKHPEWIDEAKACGLTINVWTVNDPERMEAFISKGVDFITTDKPTVLKDILNK